MSDAAHYTIKAARNGGTRDNPHGGQLVKWYIDTNEGPEDVYWQRKPGNDVTAGDSLYGRIESGEYGLRFFAEPDPALDSGGAPIPGEKTGNGSQKRSDASRDVRSAAIQRQHSQEMALRREANLIVSGRKPDGLTPEELTGLIDAFADDIPSSHDAVPSPAGTGGGSNGSPPNSVSPAQAQEFIATVDRLKMDGQDVTAKLSLLGVTGDLEDLKAAIGRIPEAKSAEMARFLLSYEKHAAEQGQEAKADGIPF